MREKRPMRIQSIVLICSGVAWNLSLEVAYQLRGGSAYPRAWGASKAMGRVSANLTDHVPQPVNAIIPSSVNDSPRRITGILWDSSVAVLSIADTMND